MKVNLSSNSSDTQSSEEFYDYQMRNLAAFCELQTEYIALLTDHYSQAAKTLTDNNLPIPEIDYKRMKELRDEITKMA